jgi:hypothetical protein
MKPRILKLWKICVLFKYNYWPKTQQKANISSTKHVTHYLLYEVSTLTITRHKDQDKPQQQTYSLYYT